MTAKTYPPGVPCWVETLHPEPRAALAFYRALFGWEASEPGSMPQGGEYYVARLNGDDVAGIATLPPDGSAEPQWTTYVSVDHLEDAAGRVVAAGGSVIVPPIDAEPAGRLAIVASPTGATFGLWEPGNRPGAQRINEPSAWAMSSIRTPDLDAALPFYTKAMGWQAEPFEIGGTKAALLRLPGYVGGLPQQPVPRDVVAVAIADVSRSADTWSVDFWIDDVDAAVERVAKNGGTVIEGPFESTSFRRAILACPSGAVFTISQLMAQGAAPRA
jgi:predicted enzyme related to lactoylglutathione lyase